MRFVIVTYLLIGLVFSGVVAGAHHIACPGDRLRLGMAIGLTVVWLPALGYAATAHDRPRCDDEAP